MVDDTNDINKYEGLYKNLLEDDNLEKLEIELQKPNIFKILGAHRMEIRHSNFLAWLLDPNGTHGLGNRFLIRVLRDLALEKGSKLKITEIGKLNFDNVEVKREFPYYYTNEDISNNIKEGISSDYKKTYKRFIDILVIFNNTERSGDNKKGSHKKIVICIENKIDSVDSDNQLKNYKEYIEKIYDANYEKIFVYLTPFGNPPKNDDTNTWYKYSYEGIIKHIEYLAKATDNFLIKTYITDYLTTLKSEIMGTNNDNATKLANEIYEQHKEIIDFVMDNKDKNLEYQITWENEYRWMIDSVNTIKDLLTKQDEDNDYELNYAKDYISLTRNGKRAYMFYAPTQQKQYSMEFSFLASENKDQILDEIDKLKVKFPKDNKDIPTWNKEATYFVIRNAMKLVEEHVDILKEINKIRFQIQD